MANVEFKWNKPIPSIVQEATAESEHFSLWQLKPKG